MENLTYKPSPNFTQLSKEPTAKELWQFLCGRESLIRAETATFLRKPVLEALGPVLQETFEIFDEGKTDKATFDKYKQLAGSMVRQIMEAQGYKLEKTGVQVVNYTIFKTAARYVKA